MTQLFEPSEHPTTMVPFTMSTRRSEARNTDGKPGGSTVSSNSVKPSGRPQRLTDAKVARRRELGLCFKCADKFGPNHVCRNKHLQLILLESEEDGDEKTAHFQQLSTVRPMESQVKPKWSSH